MDSLSQKNANTVEVVRNSISNWGRSDTAQGKDVCHQTLRSLHFPCNSQCTAARSVLDWAADTVVILAVSLLRPSVQRAAK
jgi:hypothetical protein